MAFAWRNSSSLITPWLRRFASRVISSAALPLPPVLARLQTELARFKVCADPIVDGEADWWGFWWTLPEAGCGDCEDFAAFSYARLVELGVPPARVLVDHTDRRTVRPVLECGHFAGLTVHPEELSGERVVSLVRAMGTERVVLDSDTGDGHGDILGLARAARLLERANLSPQVIARVTRQNAARFYRVEED